MDQDVTLLIGTTKGAFLLDSPDRRGWTLRGPFCDLWPINHMTGDKAAGCIWAAGGGGWTGAGVWRSTDRGETWTLAKLSDGEADGFLRDNPELAQTLGMTPLPPGPFTGQFDSVWSLSMAHGRLLAGTRPAMLLCSDDGGASWARLDGLTDHPSADSWEAGGAGLTLHTIVRHPTDPARCWVGISAAGVFGTEDHGQTWERRNRRDNACGRAATDHPAAGSDTEVGMCVHNMVRARGENDLLYQQNHHGVLSSQDGGRNWRDVTDGLPSSFGFPIAVHPHDPATIWVLPMNGDSIGRFPPGASAAVWRSRNGGVDWAPMRAGLPQENCYFTVLRQAMTTDDHATAGLYFGTNSGSVYASADEGETWNEIAKHLPTVLSVDLLR
ncbi:WD40/YVTN/BNR-like repeat-containing protein [Marinibacterium sp. SX1]|uniref:WD40/YVTN/BNR-like repeat-containing protein n=1 Tax=Marinibacterium sp. SX1 TaxID=3388424 RepID=UPI003D172F52